MSYATLGSEAILSILKGQELTVLGEGITLFTVPIPDSLKNKSLAASEIGAKTGLSVIAIKENSKVDTLVTANTVLPPDAEVVMLGNTEMKQKFNEIYVNG